MRTRVFRIASFALPGFRRNDHFPLNGNHMDKIEPEQVEKHLLGVAARLALNNLRVSSVKRKV